MATKKAKTNKALDKARKLLAKKKTAKSKKASYPKGQNAPQSKSYSMDNDKAVSAKATGWRWTEEGAKKAGKTASSKPTRADIEKYRGKTFKAKGKKNKNASDGSFRYVYNETRADKADLNKSNKLEFGGILQPMTGGVNADPRFDIYDTGAFMAKGGKTKQSSPQNPDYNDFLDIEKKAKPVGYRYNKKGLKALRIKNPYAVPTKAHIEKYPNYVYWENRADKSDMNPSKKFARGGFVTNLNEAIATPELKEKAKTKMKKGDAIISFAYTDYGGDFFDKVAIEYFEENYPKNIVVENTMYSGKNAIVFGEPAKEFIEESERYLLGFEGIEEYYYQRQSEQEREDFETFLQNIEKYRNYKVKEGALEWLLENRGGYYNITPQGVDFSESDLIQILETEDLIEKDEDYAEGGKMAEGGGATRPLYQIADEIRSDWKKVNFGAKPYLDAMSSLDKITDKYGMDSAKSIVNYFLANAGTWKGDKAKSIKAELKSMSKYEDGGEMAKGDYVVADMEYNIKGSFETFNEAKEFAEKLSNKDGEIYRFGTKEKIERHAKEDGYMADGGEMAKGGIYSSDDVWVVTFQNQDSGELEKISVRANNKKNAIAIAEDESGLSGDWQYYSADKKMASGGMMAKGGVIMHGFRKGDVIVQDYLGFAIVKDSDGNIQLVNPEKGTRFDVTLDDSKMGGGRKRVEVSEGEAIAMAIEYAMNQEPVEGFAKGGKTKQSSPQNPDYNDFLDMERAAKPVGYRYTNAKAKSLRKQPTDKPTPAHIEKYMGEGVYWENRADKSDMNPSKKFAYGGKYAKGGVERISNSEAGTYTENMLPFRANNLEGKVLENGDYVVLSYGYYPIWFFSKREAKWYGNKDKFSQSTAKHISQSRPTYDAEMVGRNYIDEVMARSIEGGEYKSYGGDVETSKE